MECDVVKKNLGVSRCNKMPEMLVGMITTPKDFSIPAATLADPALLLEYLNDAILAPAGRQNLSSGLTSKVLKTYQLKQSMKTPPIAYLPVRDGAYRFRFGDQGKHVLAQSHVHPQGKLLAGSSSLIQKIS